MIRKRPLRQNFSVLGIGCLLLGALCGPALAGGDDGPDGQSPEFQESPLRPIKVVSTTGDVRSADALVAKHEGYTTLTMVQGGIAPMIILDYGRDVGGIPIFSTENLAKINGHDT
jgi:alpha-L-rhamnosidase